MPSRPRLLENGESLHSREFLRRYERMPRVKKAELIEGIVYVGSHVTVSHAQPDALLRRLPEHGGATGVTDDGYLAGPPNLIAEIAASSASIDLRDKRRAYCRNGVREYLVWRVAEQTLDWFSLEDEEYRPQPPDAQGLLHSRTFPGLRLPVEALRTANAAEVLAALA